MRLPGPSWIVGYKTAWLPVDAVAGLTSAAVVIPQAMAYAAVAGLPIEVGLYTSLAAMLVYPLLGGSRPLSVSTTSSLAMLTATAVVATAGPAASAVQVASTLALLVGVALILARILRLGFLANFISKPVLVGFQAGVGIAILIGQLKSVLGVHVTAKTTIGVALQLPGLLPQTHVPTLIVAAAGMAVLWGLPRLTTRLSAPLVWVALSIAASAALGLGAMGIKLVGAVPSGLPALTLPNLHLVKSLWPSALGVALMSFTEGTAAARTFRRSDDPPVIANRELVAIGAANLASSVVGGMPAGGGTSQTAITDAAGARSQLAQWVAAGAVMLTLMLLSRAIGLMPQAALAALIVVAAVSMIKPETFYAIGRIRRDELMWAVATSVGVILVGTLDGILIAVVISLLTLMYQSNHPPVYSLAYSATHDAFRRAGDHAADETYPGLLMVRTEGRLTFANAEHVRDGVAALARAAKPTVIVLDCAAIPDIEYTALLMLIETEAALRAQGGELWLAGVNPGLLTILRRSPLAETLGHERMLHNVREALRVWRERQPAAAAIV